MTLAIDRQGLGNKACHELATVKDIEILTCIKLVKIEELNLYACLCMFLSCSHM